MKWALIVSLLVIVIGCLGTIGWYANHTSQVEADLRRFVEQANQKKLVKAEVVTTVPPETPKDQMLYLSGSGPELGNWDAAGVPMERGSDGKHRATVEVLSGIEYGFKVTRGTWSTVERGSAPIRVGRREPDSGWKWGRRPSATTPATPRPMTPATSSNA